MKPWKNPLLQATCYICGRPGWNMNAMDAWFGAEFRCADGCCPEDIKDYQEKLRKQNQKSVELCDGNGI